MAAKPPSKEDFDELQKTCDALYNALCRIQQWSKSYPTDVFHEPSAQESQNAHKLLLSHGMTLDAFSASMGRHCLKGVGEIALEAVRAYDTHMHYAAFRRRF